MSGVNPRGIDKRENIEARKPEECRRERRRNKARWGEEPECTE
jgi:hypothetical protein